jgi:acylpyruvate hydrolase
VRLVTFDDGTAPRAGFLFGEEIVPSGSLPRQGGSLLRSGRSVRGLLQTLDAEGLAALAEDAAQSEARFALDDVRLLAPVSDPGKIVCLGLNYRDHAAEAGQEIPGAPMWFAKFANSLIGPGEPILLPPAYPAHVDYEAELAVVIGRAATRVGVEDALSYVAGAMPFNDVTARDLQFENPLWTSGKAIDTFAPCGPALVTLDELGDLQSLALRTRVNGETLQEGTSADQIFAVAEVIAWLSRTMTLLPGDIVATGTPAGVGASQGRFLRDGDTVEVEIDGLGAVVNPVRAA